MTGVGNDAQNGKLAVRTVKIQRSLRDSKRRRAAVFREGRQVPAPDTALLSDADAGVPSLEHIDRQQHDRRDSNVDQHPLERFCILIGTPELVDRGGDRRGLSGRVARDHAGRIVPKRLFRRAALYRQNIQKPSTKNNAIRHSKQGFVVDIPHAMRYNKVNSIQINIIPFSKT